MVAFSRHVSLKSSQDSWDNSSFILFHNFHCPLGSQYVLCLAEMDAKHNYAKKTYLQILSPFLFSSSMLLLLWLFLLRHRENATQDTLLSLLQSPKCHVNSLEVKMPLLLQPEASVAGTSFPPAHAGGELGFTLTQGCQTAVLLTGEEIKNKKLGESLKAACQENGSQPPSA